MQQPKAMGALQSNLRPSSRISVIGAEQAAQVLVQIKREQLQPQGKKLSKNEEREIADPVLEKHEREGDLYFSSSLIWDDGIIDPLQNRQVIGRALSACLNASIERGPAPVFRM